MNFWKYLKCVNAHSRTMPMLSVLILLVMMMMSVQLNVVEALLRAVANTEYTSSQREAAVTLSCLCHVADDSLLINQRLALVVGPHLHHLILVRYTTHHLPPWAPVAILARGGAKYLLPFVSPLPCLHSSSPSLSSCPVHSSLLGRGPLNPVGRLGKHAKLPQ